MKFAKRRLFSGVLVSLLILSFILIPVVVAYDAEDFEYIDYTEVNKTIGTTSSETSGIIAAGTNETLWRVTISPALSGVMTQPCCFSMSNVSDNWENSASWVIWGKVSNTSYFANFIDFLLEL